MRVKNEAPLVFSKSHRRTTLYIKRTAKIRNSGLQNFSVGMYVICIPTKPALSNAPNIIHHCKDSKTSMHSYKF